MKTTIYTNRYERSHSKAPRGRAQWVFADHADNIVVIFSGSYGEAKRAAQASGYTTLYVCP